MKVFRFGALAGVLGCIVAWIWAYEPDSSALRAELIGLSEKEGLALASFYSTPATLTQFGQPDHVLLGTAEFGFAGVSPDGGHLFVDGPKGAFSGLEKLDGTPMLAIAVEALQRTDRYWVSADLRHVALRRYGDGDSVTLVDLSTQTPTEIKILDDKLRRSDSVSWSPTASQVAFEYERGIYIYDLASGTSRWIASGARPSWSPDGAWIAYRSLRDEAIIIRSQGQGAHRIIAGKVANGFSWSPDSRYLLFAKEYRIQIPLGPPGYIGAYRLSDGARCKIEDCSFKGMDAPEAFSWVKNYKQILSRFQPI